MLGLPSQEVTVRCGPLYQISRLRNKVNFCLCPFSDWTKVSLCEFFVNRERIAKAAKR